MIFEIYDLGYNNLVELQEQMEQELEETKEKKETSDKDSKIITTPRNYTNNTSILATAIHYFDLSEVANEVITPPPEYC